MNKQTLTALKGSIRNAGATARAAQRLAEGGPTLVETAVSRVTAGGCDRAPASPADKRSNSLRVTGSAGW